MPRSRLRFIIFLSLYPLCAMVPADADPPAEGLPAEAIAHALARNRVPGARVGVVARRLSDGKEFFSQRGTERFDMASNTKLFTTAAALSMLGPEYEFRTAVIMNGRVEGDKLLGDLVIVGGGDPSLSGRFTGGDVMAVPREIAASVQRRGIRVVTGDLVMDDRLFDRVHRAPGWPRDEHLWWYAAPVGALSFNDNCADIRVTGAAAAGSAALLSVSPDVPYVRVVNRCMTCRTRAEEGVMFVRQADGALEVGGCIRIGRTRTESIAVEEPALFLASAIRAQLSTLGITVQGRDRTAGENETALPEAREIYVHQSRLTDAVAVANRRSQNFYAEQILKTLGAARTGVGSFRSGITAVQEFLTKSGFPAGTVLLADGSGLSPGNRATPQAIAALLEIMYRSELRDAFFDSLAVNGNQETTLRKRMTAPPMRGRIHAKTGTIKTRGVRALSGYAEALNGQVYAFAILTNGFRPGRLSKVWAMEDAVCRALVGGGEE